MKKTITKKALSMICCLAMLAGLLIPMTDRVDAASISWDNLTISATTDNAMIKIRANAPYSGHWSAASGTVRDTKGNIVATKSEGTNYNLTYLDIWYDIQGEMGKSLKAGTAYTFQFTATFNNTTYQSPLYKFTTKGSNGSTAVSMSWENLNVSTSTNNAVVRIKANAHSKGHWSAASGKVRDVNGNIVASKSENANYDLAGLDIWYDIQDEMRTSLKPGTQYTFQFTATYNGKTYKSPKYSFTTKSANASSNSNAGGKVNQFLSDSRWANGTTWGGDQMGKVSSYQSWGCCAYCADFAKFVFGKNSPRDGAAFTSTNDIRANDILQLDGHWLVVLSRSGNTLKVAEGNVAMQGRCQVMVSTDVWTISGNSLKSRYESFSRALITGYHFN